MVSSWVMPDERFVRAVRITNVMTKLHVEDPIAFPRDARHAYYMSELEYLRALEEAGARQETVSAVYHSHFGQGCYLSQDDLAFAAHPLFPFPDAAQIVVSVLGDRVQDVGCSSRRATRQQPFVGRRLEARRMSGRRGRVDCGGNGTIAVAAGRRCA